MQTQVNAPVDAMLRAASVLPAFFQRLAQRFRKISQVRLMHEHAPEHRSKQTGQNPHKVGHRNVSLCQI